MSQVRIGAAFSAQETTAINGLSDVTITSPADNDLLAYDSATSQWTNQTPTQAGLDDLYLNQSLNLSDLPNAATARTNLGLVAGGAGDIWVEKAGDTITGQLMIDGGSDQIQLLVQANATQTSNLAVFENSSGTDLVTITGAGLFGVGIAPSGAQLHVKATTGSIAKFGDGTSDARFELLRDTGGGATMQFHAGDAVMESDGNWQLKHEGASKIKMKNSTNGKEVWVDTTTPSIYTGGADDLILGRNQTEIIKLVSGGADVTGLLQTDTFRIDQTPTLETVVQTHTITISANGTNYKLLALAA